MKVDRKIKAVFCLFSVLVFLVECKATQMVNESRQNTTTIQEEKTHNQFLKENTIFEEFNTLLNKRELPLPKHIKKSVPANLKSGNTNEE